MKLKFKNKVMLAAALLMLVDIVSHGGAAFCQKQKEKQRNEENLRAVQPLVYYVGSILGGYTDIADGDNEMSFYNTSSFFEEYIKEGAGGWKETDEKPNSIWANIEVLRVEHDGTRGYVWLEWWNQFVPHGAGDSGQDLWFIEKNDWKWEVKHIDGGLDGRWWLWR